MTTNTILSKRLFRISELVDKRRVADIGCDHGKLVEALFEMGKIDYAFIGDISKPCLDKAVKLLTENDRQFDCAVADGLQKIKVEYNIEQVIISGMGGLEIIKILENSPLSLTNFVLQPQNNEIKLKLWLNENNFEIYNDLIVKDGHIYYNMFKAIKVNKVKKQKLFYLKYGKVNFNGNLDFYEYLKYSLTKYTQLLNLAPSKNKELMKEIKDLKKAIKIWERKNEKNVTVSKIGYGSKENSKIS